jgi:hypothetical protein
VITRGLDLLYPFSDLCGIVGVDARDRRSGALIKLVQPLAQLLVGSIEASRRRNPAQILVERPN